MTATSYIDNGANRRGEIEDGQRTGAMSGLSEMGEGRREAIETPMLNLC